MMPAPTVARVVYRLTQADGSVVERDVPGLFGGNRRMKIYGRLDCPSALRALSRGYAKRRVFFADEAAAIAAGYRPCAVCMPGEYRRWKAASHRSASVS
jgi:methylphosphotriester-DNA--protein-cysteine methyltransferase